MSDGGGCKLAHWKVWVAITAVIGLIGACWIHCHAGRGATRGFFTRRRPPPSIDAFIGGGAVVGASLYPSGAWRGYYTQGRRQHGVCEFHLAFEADGRVAGEGVDDIGAYTIRGRHGDGRVAFSKRYCKGSRTAAGQLSPENQGHAVEYRGAAARTLAEGRPSLSGGVRGSWAIRHALGDLDGAWHLWPVMNRWQQQQSDGAHGGDQSGCAGQAVDRESECCVCYDRPIDTCLMPCGHVALCWNCASRLPQRRCPLCRADIIEMQPVRARG